MACSDLSTLSTDTTRQLDVLWHDGHTLRVDGAQIGVLEQTDQVGLTSLLQSPNGGTLEPQICLEILGNLPHQPLEWQLPYQQLSGLLVSPNLPESHSSRPIPVGLLDTSGSWRRLTSSLRSKLLPRSLSSGGLASGLLSSSHHLAVKDVIASTSFCLT